MDKTLQLVRAFSLTLLAVATGCDSNPNQLTLRPVTAGHVGGVSFMVTGGTIFQAEPDGPLYADATGGQLVLDDTPSGLGMTDPDLLHVSTQFALSDGGSIQLVAFGDTGSEFDTGASVELSRTGINIFYDFRFGGSVFLDSVFVPAPSIPSGEHWIVTEFYADSVPGYGPGQSGVTMWPLNDVTPSAGGDVLGCDPGPAVDATALAGEGIGYALQRAWLLVVDVEDQIIGPCT